MRSATPLGAAKYMLGGMIVYRHRNVFGQRWTVALSGLFAAAMAVLIAMTFMGSELPAELPRSTILLFACPFLMFAELPGFQVLLENRIARHLGLTSYSIYLLQLPIIQELEKLGFAADVVTLTAIVVAISTISYFAVERPFLTWFRAGHGQPKVTFPKPVVPKQVRLADARR